MTTRLQSTLIRIMTQDGSPYRDDIIRIQSMKPISKSVPQNPKESKFTKDFKSFFSKERGGSGGPGVSGVSTAGAAGPSPTVAPLAVNGTSKLLIDDFHRYLQHFFLANLGFLWCARFHA